MRRYIIKLGLLLFPFIIGVIGFLPHYHNNILWAMYSSIRLYSLNLDISYPYTNTWLEMARWLAPIAVTGFILSSMHTIKQNVKKWYIRVIDDGTIFYGDNSYVEKLFIQRASRAFWVKGEQFYKAKNQVIMLGTDQKNLEFYARNKIQFEDCRVFMELSSSMHDLISNANVHMIDFAENTARSFWKEHPVLKNERIVIVGFGKVGRALLTFALKTNVFSMNQCVEYHIFGNIKTFCAIHKEMNSITGDKLFFYENTWQAQLDVLDRADRIILTGDEGDALEQLADLILGIGYRNYFVKVEEPLVLNAFKQKFDCISDSYRLISFGSLSQICSEEIVFNEGLYKQSKEIHDYYMQLYNGKPWQDIDGFEKYSNIASADHVQTKKWLRDRGMPIEQIAEIEHERWCRYYYVNNWRYGLEKSEVLRTHPCLKPYPHLSDSEKDKDRVLCQLILK